MRHAKKRDDNERGIINVLEAAGAVVTQLEHLDLLVGFRGEWFLIEVKNLDVNPPADAIGVKACRPGGEWHNMTDLFGKYARYLRESQAKWIRANRDQAGTIAIVTNGTEALQAIGAIE